MFILMREKQTILNILLIVFNTNKHLPNVLHVSYFFVSPLTDFLPEPSQKTLMKFFL